MYFDNRQLHTRRERCKIITIRIYFILTDVQLLERAQLLGGAFARVRTKNERRGNNNL